EERRLCRQAGEVIPSRAMPGWWRRQPWIALKSWCRVRFPEKPCVFGLGIIQVWEEFQDPAAYMRRAAALGALPFVNRVPELSIHLSFRRSHELVQNRLERLDPPGQVEAAEFPDSTGDLPPILRRPFQGDGRDAAERVDLIAEEGLHRVQKHDF